MIGRLDNVALDATDINQLAAFYAQLTGWQVVRTDDDWIEIATSGGERVAFQLAADHVPPQWPSQEHPQQFHLDLTIDDIEAAAERAVALGATRLGTGASWITLADPAGHPFDLCQRDGVGPEMGIFAVTIDTPDAGALARFYGEVCGMPVLYEGPEGALIGADDRNIMFQQISGYQAPRWPDPAYPQQAHLDVDVTDLDAAEKQVLALGARALPSEAPDRFRVFADPDGHPFCLCLASTVDG